MVHSPQTICLYFTLDFNISSTKIIALVEIGEIKIIQFSTKLVLLLFVFKYFLFSPKVMMYKFILTPLFISVVFF